ncbi:MAG TPA: VOC family protein [Kineosporiaceae bacterium]|jgi:predicted enzyme related to lactoylglutathione lyase|nr:VOC family protein [Kineosporiaceae bacterium]
MLRGLSTVSFYAQDVDAARRWYAELLGVDAYFVREMEGTPVYVEFRIGDHEHELGIIDSRFAPGGGSGRPGGAIVYWHVDDVRAVVDRLVDSGATVFEDVVARGPGFVTASVVDPFGNVLGVMENAHYLDTLSRTATRGR